MAGTRRTYVKRISIGRPIASINQAASGVVSALVRSPGQILIDDANTNLYQSGDLLGGHGINKYFDSVGRNIVLSLDSADLKSIIDSNYIAFVTDAPHVDSAYVEQNSLDSERTLSLLDSELKAWTNHIRPYADSTYDLGSPTRRWRSLYLSGQTIHLGGLRLGDESSTFAIRDSAGNAAALNLDGNTTDDLAEGSNLYYTRARFDSALATSLSTASIRSYFSSVDSGGDGAFFYDSSNGVFTYRGPSAAEVRAHFSAQGDLSYDSATGVFSFDVEQVYTQANFESDLSQSVAGGTGITYDSATQTISITNTGVIAGQYGSQTQVPIITVNAQGQIDSIGEILVAGVTGFSLDSTSGVLTITTADGGSFSAPIHSRDSALLTDISGTTLNYGTGRISQLTSDSAVITTIDNNVLRTNDLNADSAVATNISGTDLNYGTGHISQLTSDSASITTIDNNVLRTNQLDADSAHIGNIEGDSASITNISGTDLNYGTGHISQFTADSASTGNLTISGNLTVSGTTTTVSSQTLSVNDPLIHLADSNEYSDVIDIGFMGHYYRDAQRRHTGFFRDASNQQYYLFHQLVDSSFDSSVPPSVVNRGGTDFAGATLNVGQLLADSATFTNINVTGLATTTISRAATVDSGTYGSATLIPVMTVNASGFIDSIGEIAVAGVSGVSWDSTNEQLTINTADGGSFVTTINGFDSAQITNVSGTTLNYAQVLSDSAKVISISGTDLNYGTGQISQLTVDSGTFTTLAINGRTIDSDWVQSFAKNFEGDITITTTQDDAAAGPSLILDRNTASAADSDIIGEIIFKGQDDAAAEKEYAKISAYIDDATAATPAGAIDTQILDGSGYIPATRLSKDGFEVSSQIPFSLTGAFIYQGATVDSDWVGSRAKEIISPEIKYIDVDDGATQGPTLILDRNSASPADSDAIGYIEFRGRNSADSETEYASLRTYITDASADSEDAELMIHLKQAGFDRMKVKFSQYGMELPAGERIGWSTDSYQQFIQAGSYTSNHVLTLPDSSGTLLTRDFVFELIDSAYIGARQAATGINIQVKDRDSDIIFLPVTQAAATTGGIVSFGNTITILGEDSADVVITL